jgi:hypothetical protein
MIADASRGEPKHEPIAIRLASPDLLFPGNAVKHLGSGRATATAVTSRPSNEATIESALEACQLQGFIRVRSSSDEPVLCSSSYSSFE